MSIYMHSPVFQMIEETPPNLVGNTSTFMAYELLADLSYLR